ncbi:3-deoxy-D-manno-octulosonic acid kinase [Pasteurellaceae bacterium RH1A]|nr:3-deoxy-D-manno-octulosonic acid kinase [Pasteurellaceae bacterium RH1A]
MNYYHFNPDLVKPDQENFVKDLLICKNFEHSNRLLGASRGRGITWFLDTRPELGLTSVLRHYYRGGLFGKLIKDSYFFQGLDQTRAAQEFDLLLKMHQWGLPVPRPIAYQIKKSFCCYQADILLERIENTRDLSQILQESELENEQYQKIGQLIRQLHDRQVHHSDLNIHNILLDKQGNFWLIDFDKCRIQPGQDWKQANLERLLRSFRKEQGRLNIRFSDENWQALLAGYQM